MTRDPWSQRGFFSTGTSPVAPGTHQKKVIYVNTAVEYFLPE